VGCSGESSPADLRSSNRASPSGRAEGYFSGELGSARSAGPGYQTAKYVKIWGEMGIAELTRATKHALTLITFHCLTMYATKLYIAFWQQSSFVFT
jgi:hypothetical protein